MDGVMYITPQAAPYYNVENLDAFAYFDSSLARDYMKPGTIWDCLLSPLECLQWTPICFAVAALFWGLGQPAA
eukprot:2931930-Rhodomonas_salina.1